MWNKRNDEPFPPRQQPEPVRSTAPPAQPAPPRPEPAPIPVHAPPPASKQAATIGPAMSIKGEIRAREELLVDGEVEGLLESQSLITVGPSGKVKANIQAREVVI